MSQNNRKPSAMPIIALLICCTLLSIWVWKNVPMAGAADTAGMELTSLELSALLTEEQPILLNFSSDTCPYCLIMAPELGQIYQQWKDRAVIREINLDRNPEVMTQLPIRSTPTQLLINADGTPYQPSETVQAQMNFIYYVSQVSGAHMLTVHEGMLTAEQMQLILQDMGVTV